MDSLFTVSGCEEVGRELLKDVKEAKAKQFFKDVKDVVIKETTKDGDSWLSMCFLMKGGKEKRGYLSTKSELEEGDHVDKNTIEVIYLEQDGVELKPRYDGEVAD